jgi:hypothetical protein
VAHLSDGCRLHVSQYVTLRPTASSARVVLRRLRSRADGGAVPRRLTADTPKASCGDPALRAFHRNRLASTSLLRTSPMCSCEGLPISW